jgi:hypothetical protein
LVARPSSENLSSPHFFVFVRSVRSLGQCPPRPKNTPQPGCPRPATGGPHAPQTAARLSLSPHSSHQQFSPSSSPPPRPHRLLPSPTAPRPVLTEAALHRTETGAHAAAEAGAHLRHRCRIRCTSRTSASQQRWRPLCSPRQRSSRPGGGGCGGPSRRQRRLLSPAAASEPNEEIPGTRLLVCFLFRDPIDFVFSFQGLDCFLVL